jgi:hypothetical protein
MPRCANLCTAKKIAWRCAAGTSSLITLLDTSTKTLDPCSCTDSTRNTGDNRTRWQSASPGCAAAISCISTGGELALGGPSCEGEEVDGGEGEGVEGGGKAAWSAAAALKRESPGAEPVLFTEIAEPDRRVIYDSPATIR